MDVTLPHGPDFFQFGTPERIEAALTEAGFTDPAAYSFSQDWRVANANRVDSFRRSSAGGACFPIRCCSPHFPTSDIRF
jgi:hypothetical protein